MKLILFLFFLIMFSITISNAYADDHTSNLYSDELSGYLTVISIFIATTGFMIGIMPKPPPQGQWKYFMRMDLSLIWTSLFLTGIGIGLTILNVFFLLVFVTLLVPIFTLLSVVLEWNKKYAG